MVQSLHARCQFLIAALLAAIACACLLFATAQTCTPSPALASFEGDSACANSDTSAEHHGADSDVLIAVDDERDGDEDELSGASVISELFGPRAPSRICATAALAHSFAPQTLLERPPRA